MAETSEPGPPAARRPGLRASPASVHRGRLERAGALAAVRAVAALAALALAGGCYHYVPVTADQLTPAADIRARVTSGEAERLQALLMRAEIQAFDARFLALRNGSMLLQVPVVNELRGMRLETLHQRVDIPLSSILSLEQRELDRGRTSVAVGAVGVAVAALLVSQFRDAGGSGRERPDPPAESRMPLAAPIPWR